MFAVVRVAGLVLCLAGLIAAGCSPAATSSGGTPSSKTTPSSGKPKPPQDDRG